MKQPTPALRVGLALSGGGGKGSYQAGVFQALHQLEARPRLWAVSGCSIGALNALLLLAGTPEMWRDMWVGGSLWHTMTGGRADAIDPARLRELSLRATRAKSLPEYLAMESLLPQDSLRQLLTDSLDPALLRSAPTSWRRRSPGTSGWTSSPLPMRWRSPWPLPPSRLPSPRWRWGAPTTATAA